jgi:hypothetical protein
VKVGRQADLQRLQHVPNDPMTVFLCPLGTSGPQGSRKREREGEREREGGREVRMLTYDAHVTPYLLT